MTAVREAVERLDRVGEEGIARLGELHAARTCGRRASCQDPARGAAGGRSSAGWVTKSVSAARLTVRVRATSTNASICAINIDLVYIEDRKKQFGEYRGSAYHGNTGMEAATVDTKGFGRGLR